MLNISILILLALPRVDLSPLNLHSHTYFHLTDILKERFC